MDEFPMTGQADPDPFDESRSSFDELILAGWDPSDHGDPASDPDDEDAWWASLPPDIRAELLARPPLPAALWSTDGECRAGFAAGRSADAAPPGLELAVQLAAATRD
ncbi:MAG: hypothetical protein WBH47_24480, partial [Streptosporangiaceae bacterium]